MTREEELFAKASELPATARAAFLDHACAGDAPLRARLESLLYAHAMTDGFLQQPLVTRADGDAMREEKSGARIGRYKLLEKIGEGGCGIVWAADQSEPVRRRVALKIIKLGMDTKEVIARFEAERQALALMDHPNIAHVFDAGATATGRPFFVMELVHGIPITRFCDDAQLPLEARLKLFIDVCHAIQHAHQKGIIHRDIKPSNILVTLHDDVAVPKVIDFGIAKAIQGRLTDATVYTSFAQFIGTPAYMCPEQAEFNALDVDTRGDVYSLGVLLYELLAGQPPFDPKTLGQTGLDEVRRIIREVEPPPPSTRVRSITKDAARHPDVEQNPRSVKPRPPPASANELRGDLDWIVMKALEKNRTRRYQTANALAADVQRYLDDDLVLARPPSVAYRLQKLITRHKAAFAAGALVVISLVAGLAIATGALVREKEAHQNADRAERLASDARQNAERLLTFIVSELGEQLDQLGHLPTLRGLNRQILDYYEQIDPVLHTRETRAGLALARVGNPTVGWLTHDRTSDFRLGDSSAEQRFEEALAVMQELESSGSLTPLIRVAYAGVLWGKAGHLTKDGHKSAGIPLLEKAETILQPALTDSKWGDWADRFTMKLILGRGYLAHDFGVWNQVSARKMVPVIAAYQRALDRAEARDRRGVRGRWTGLLAAEARWRLSAALYSNNQRDEARKVNAIGRAQLRELLGREPFLVGAITYLSLLNHQFATQGLPLWRIEECRAAYDESIRELERVWKIDPTASTLTNWLAQNLSSIGIAWAHRDFRSAEGQARKSIELLTQPHLRGDSQVALRTARFNLARLYAATSCDAEADQQLTAAQAVSRRLAEERSWLTPTEKLNRSIADETRRCVVEAERLNWAALRTSAQRILQAGAVGTEQDGETTEPTNSAQTAHRYLMQAAFETGDYATARRELEAWSPPTVLLKSTAEIEFRFQRVLILLTRIHVLARAGELATARSELARIWGNAEQIFDTGREHLFVHIEHARALSIRAEVEDAATATKRTWLEHAAGMLRPAATAGRLTRYEREVTLRRIEQQLAELGGAATP